MLACFFTSYRLKIKGKQFFKTVIYMPNIIMASAFAMLFYMLFSNVGQIKQILTHIALHTCSHNMSLRCYIITADCTNEIH